MADFLAHAPATATCFDARDAMGDDSQLRALLERASQVGVAQIRAIGDAVSKRLNDQYDATMAAQEAAGSGAIIHIKRDALAVREFLRGKIYVNRGRLHGSQGNEDGYGRGHSTGSAVALTPRVFHNASGRASRLLGS